MAGHGRNFDHLIMVILKFSPWSWSKILNHVTMTPGRVVGQKVKNRGCLTQPPAPLDLWGSYRAKCVDVDSEIPVISINQVIIFNRF